MTNSILSSSKNNDNYQHIRVFSEGSEEEVLVVPFAESITVNQLVESVIGSADENIFVTKKGSSVVFDGVITTSTDVISLPNCNT